jgi:uncharacterized damage-inducible protein DinB
MKILMLFATLVFLLPSAITQQSSTNPVADAVRHTFERQAKNLTAAAEEMPADKYGFHPTPQQMTFGKLVEHIAKSNRIVCAGIAGAAEPKGNGATETDGKDKLVTDMKDSFDYCSSVLAKVDDSKLGEQVNFFGGHKVSRAAALMAVTNDLADHYAAAAMYLRLNGLLPPTAQKK